MQMSPGGGLAPTLQSSSEWRRIQDQFALTGKASIVMAGLTAATDEIVLDAWRGTLEPSLSQPAVMFATGAYGRGETFPYSGANILVVFDSSRETESVQAPLAGFAQLLWDAGLRLDYVVRTLAECLDPQSPELAVGLLDRRYLAGDRALASRLDSRLPAMLERHAPKIRQHVCQTTLARHTKFRDTCCHLEPDVKDGPGGLRDLRTVDWLTRPEPIGHPTDPDRSPHRAEALKEAAAFLTAARCFLHYHHGCDSNLLNAAAREKLAGHPVTRGATPAEWWREYYQHARLVFGETRHACETAGKSMSSLLENFREYRTRLSNAEFTVSRERLLLRTPAQLESDPALILRMLEFVARHGVAPAAETDLRLEAAASAFAGYCSAQRPLWPALSEILAGPHAPMALRALDRCLLLSALFPEWAAVENTPQPQSGYCYTADEHSLTAVDCVAALRSESDAARQRFAELLSEIDRPAVLVFALLFVEAGGERARSAMDRVEMPAEERSTVEFLIAHRNALADAAGGRDLQDPATVRGLAATAGTIERLKCLALLTFARMAAASPEAVPAWRTEQLWQAYAATRQELTRELETDRIQQPPAGLPGNAEFLAGFPVRYLRSHLPAEIEGHLALYEASRPTGVAVRMDEIEGAYRLTIIARDRPFLFASFAGALTSFGLDILKAEAFSNARGIILDTFVAADPKRMLQLNPSEAERLRDLLQRIAVGKTGVERLMRDRHRTEPRKPARPPQISFDSEACETATLVEIDAEDRPGLLYSLATVFSTNNCNIDVVLIDTKGHRALDVFYVAHQGAKLPAEVRDRLKDSLIAAC